MIRLLRPLPTVSGAVVDQDFGVLFVWRESLIVTYNRNSLFVLDPVRALVVASLTNVNHLHSVAVTNSEIFIIEGMRNIIRLAYTPDKFGSECY